MAISGAILGVQDPPPPVVAGCSCFKKYLRRGEVMSSRWEQKWWTFYYTITCSLAKGAGGKENIAHLPLRMRQTEKRRQKVSMMKHPYSSPSFFRALQGNLRFDLFLPRKKLRSLKLFINSGMCQLAIWPP